jgi:hypothetical protein
MLALTRLRLLTNTATRSIDVSLPTMSSFWFSALGWAANVL